ncbi:hypothetical protein DFS34DRAFT_623576 [Phlyctochytrium arcticum]|nr:hypothetical protein DFS34DRAFT_623576 [Phlyctochytrium arcticum]
MPSHRGGSSDRSGHYRPSETDEIGSDAKKYNGLFCEQDWKCKLCHNINWKRRNTCNVCNSPKPGTGTDAQREGFGGGFMDREPRVEYRSSSFKEDDQYDDFGRLKKRRGTSVGSSVPDESLNGSKAQNGSKEGDDDDDDDDGDDGKYDAWADILGGDETKPSDTHPPPPKKDGPIHRPPTSSRRSSNSSRHRSSRSRSPYRHKDTRRSRSRSRGYDRRDSGRTRHAGRSRSRSPYRRR